MCIPSIRTRNPLLGWLLIIIVCTLSGILRIVKHSMWYFENYKVYGLPSGDLKRGELPLCTELPVRVLLGNSVSHKRGFSETQSLEGLSTTDRRCASVLSTDASVPTC